MIHQVSTVGYHNQTSLQVYLIIQKVSQMKHVIQKKRSKKQKKTKTKKQQQQINNTGILV